MKSKVLAVCLAFIAGCTSMQQKDDAKLAQQIEAAKAIANAGVAIANQVAPNNQGVVDAKALVKAFDTIQTGVHTAIQNVDYVVVKGDCLSKIAEDKTGSAFNWYSLYKVNRDQIVDPDLIYEGMDLSWQADKVGSDEDRRVAFDRPPYRK